MEEKLAVEEFVVAEGDPLAAEHADVMAWVAEALESAGPQFYYQDVDMKGTKAGRKLLEAKPDQARRYVLAAIEQVRYWDDLHDQFKEQAQREERIAQFNQTAEHAYLWGHRRQAGAPLTHLLRRNLPFDRNDLALLLSFCLDVGIYYFEAGVVRAVEHYAEREPLDKELSKYSFDIAREFRSYPDKQRGRWAMRLEQLCIETNSEVRVEPEERRPAPQPHMVGSVAVLVQLKKLWNIVGGDENGVAELIGPDRFALRVDSPYKAEHEQLSRFFSEVVDSEKYHECHPKKFATGRVLLEWPRDRQAALFLASCERHVHALSDADTDYNNRELWQSQSIAGRWRGYAKVGSIEWTRDEAFDALLYIAAYDHGRDELTPEGLEALISQVAAFAEDRPLSEGERYVLHRLRAVSINGPLLGRIPPEISQLTRLIGDGATFCLVPGEVWADQVNGESVDWSAAERQKWVDLFSHLVTATSARPSAKWLKRAEELLAPLGTDVLKEALIRWLPLVAKGRSLTGLAHYQGDTRSVADTMADENATILRGLLWLIPRLEGRDELVRLVTQVILSAYKKVPGVGPRAVKVGNAGVYALSEMVSELTVGQLAMLKLKVKFGTAQKEIEKAFNKAADALGLPRDEIEEMGVPTYGLEEVGRLAETLGEYRAEIVVNGSDATLAWYDAKGKALKSIPAKVQKEHAEEVKELKQTLKDLKSMLPAQRDRIDGMFLLRKSWPVEKWRERYLDHPLVGTIARRLIWNVDGTPALFVDGEAQDVSGAPVDYGKTAEITLWHPVEREVDEVLAWRRRLEELGITQPFKQAHREVYVLTDAERRTGTYSNRFAAHVVKQHQFHALCAARGWKNQLRLLVDASYNPPTKSLPDWGLRAEFWVEGIGDDYGHDTNDAGAFLYLATDQVRFYRTEAAENMTHASGGRYETRAAGPGTGNINEPLPLSEIPPLVFSEVLRDVDLFVGVASVANNPNWQDGGPEGRYRDYWQSVSFGELSATANTRKGVLEQLIPRLKIADRCSFSERFLRVEGTKRAYKIHLGSGNILMEPNDEYLCIVPDGRARATKEDVFLPFEGDNTLSIILSKALLLAADDKITDPTILTQINRGARS